MFGEGADAEPNFGAIPGVKGRHLPISAKNDSLKIIRDKMVELQREWWSRDIAWRSRQACTPIQKRKQLGK